MNILTEVGYTDVDQQAMKIGNANPIIHVLENENRKIADWWYRMKDHNQEEQNLMGKYWGQVLLNVLIFKYKH